MKRRDFLGILAAAAAWPHRTLAQQDSTRHVPIVGFVGFANPAIDYAIVMPFRRGLADLGYVEGRTIIVEVRNANGDVTRGHAIIDGFAAEPVDVLFTPGPAAARPSCARPKSPWSQSRCRRCRAIPSCSRASPVPAAR